MVCSEPFLTQEGLIGSRSVLGAAAQGSLWLSVQGPTSVTNISLVVLRRSKGLDSFSLVKKQSGRASRSEKSTDKVVQENRVWASRCP